jgi:hypothetical protein
MMMFGQSNRLFISKDFFYDSGKWLHSLKHIKLQELAMPCIAVPFPAPSKNAYKVSNELLLLSDKYFYAFKCVESLGTSDTVIINNTALVQNEVMSCIQVQVCTPYFGQGMIYFSNFQQLESVTGFLSIFKSYVGINQSTIDHYRQIRIDNNHACIMIMMAAKGSSVKCTTL